VYICEECVDVCVGIIADDRRSNRGGQEGSGVPVVGSTPAKRDWPASDAWCAFCAGVADLETALLIENRTLLCEACIRAIALAATEAHKVPESKE
jgi:hypothetical protein